MGSKGGIHSQPPTPSSPSIVCCMCGDHGLPRELFRCKGCLTRFQHKYCSDLYLKTESYQVCNWCLRTERGKAGGYVSVSPIDSSNSTVNNNNVTNDVGAAGAGVGAGDGDGGCSGPKLHRQVSQSGPYKPVKKPRALQRSASEVIERVRSSELSPGSTMRRHVFRGKVRRYKLLEEVSS